MSTVNDVTEWNLRAYGSGETVVAAKSGRIDGPWLDVMGPLGEDGGRDADLTRAMAIDLLSVLMNHGGHHGWTTWSASEPDRIVHQLAEVA